MGRVYLHFIQIILFLPLFFTSHLLQADIFNCEDALRQQIIQPLSRSHAIAELKHHFQNNAIRLKQSLLNHPRTTSHYDMIIIGGGPATIAFISGFRKVNSRAKILVIDESQSLAPAFEGPGRALIFNSETIVDEMEAINSHHFPNHFIQLTDFEEFKESHRIYPTGEDITALTWSQFASLDTDLLLNTKATALLSDVASSQMVVQTAEDLKINARQVILATGQGEPKLSFLDLSERKKVLQRLKSNEINLNQLGIETYLQALTYINQNQLDPIKYENKKVAVIGGGDAALGIIEILMALQMPSLQYGINIHKRTPSLLTNYGARWIPPNRNKFIDQTKRRYHHLRGIGGLFLNSSTPLPAGTRDVRPLLSKQLFFKTASVNSIKFDDNQVYVQDDEGVGGVFDHVILATGYINEAMALLQSEPLALEDYTYEHTPRNWTPLHGDIDIEGGSYPANSAHLTTSPLTFTNARLGFKVDDLPVYLIANAAGAPLIVSDEEALDGSNDAHRINFDKARSSTYSKYTLQHMLPRAYTAGLIIGAQ